MPRVSGAANTIFLLRSAGHRSEPFPSSGSRIALIAIAPGFLIAAAITIVLARYPAASCVLVLLQGSLSLLVHQVRGWYSGVAIKMGRRQGATREHI
jgi:hypothetical protein